MLEPLLEVGILEEKPGQERIGLTDSFIESVQRFESAEAPSYTPSPVVAEFFEESNRPSSDEAFDFESIYSMCKSVDEFVDLESTDELIRTVFVLDTIRSNTRDEGAPDGFQATSGNALAAFIEWYPQAIIYVWREDCPPCDAMEKALSATVADSGQDVGLFAVYGPSSADVLSIAFDVVGAPTTLFVRDGTVDSRLVGAHSRNVIENEIGIIRS
jgi:thiol-disulfide isomerase/thioredoxin